MSTNSHFDQLADQFADKIYNSDKGRIRLSLLQQDLQQLRDQPVLSILDAGGGQGHMSRWFAAAGHRIVLCDSSRPMLDRALQLNKAEGLSDRIRLEHAEIMDFCRQQQSYDLILCHAVLEWSEQPRQLLGKLTTQLKPGGRLSLMFYNRHSLVLRNALRGNLRKVRRGDWRGDGKGLTPMQPIDPDQLYGWLEQDGLHIDALSGIRCFYDYLPLKVRQTYDFNDILELERVHYRQQPYIHMARYIHVLATRQD